MNYCHNCQYTQAERYFRCSRCRAAEYCSKECRLEHLQEHKRICSRYCIGNYYNTIIIHVDGRFEYKTTNDTIATLWDPSWPESFPIVECEGVRYRIEGHSIYQGVSCPVNPIFPYMTGPITIRRTPCIQIVHTADELLTFGILSIDVLRN